MLRRNKIKEPAVGKKSKAAAAVAHFVSPASKLAAAKRGEVVKSVCGEATITGDAVAGAAICQKCVLAQLTVDDMKTDERARNEYNRGMTAGTATGERNARAAVMREIREAAERRATDEKALAS